MNLPRVGQALLAAPVRFDMYICSCVAEALHFMATSLSRFSAQEGDVFIPAEDVESRAVIPTGYGTVLEYYQRTNPEAFSLLYDPEEELKDDEIWIAEQCGNLGHPIAETGGVKAYPLTLIQKRFG